MARTVKPEVLERIRPLVQQGLKGHALAQAAGLSDREARWYAAQLRAERPSPNGAGHEATPKAAIVEVSIDEIQGHLWTQVREKLDPAVIDDYVEAMTEGATFPPVVLFYDGEEYWIGDGHHRCRAAKHVGFKSIQAEVREGGQREAKLYAASANQAHGLRRTNRDKQRAVLVLLKDEEWEQRSDREIARHCGVSPTFVGSLRASLSTVDSDDGQRTYTTKHGTVATMDTSRIGTRAEPATPTNGGALDAPQVSLPPSNAPETDDDEGEEWDEAAEDYTLYFQTWAALSELHTAWMIHVQSGDALHDRQFPQELVKRAGQGAARHIEELQEMANSLQAFAAALQRALEAPDA